MEALHLPNEQTPFLEVVVNNKEKISPFIEANTKEATIQEINGHHIIPVFHNNEPLISQGQFIETVTEVVWDRFQGEKFSQPSIRLSHPIMGRIPEARDKPVKELQDWEKTLYYERMAFLIEVSSITDTIDGQTLSLTVGGVKSYNLDNLYSRKGSEQHFKCFIGFKVSVCTNLCVWTDGLLGEIKIRTVPQLREEIKQLVTSFDAISNLKKMAELETYSLSQQQFAHLIGRCKMYQFLSPEIRRGIPEFLFGDQQINAVCRDYYKDTSFQASPEGCISLWRLYNLFTSAAKSTYIDQFLERSVNASEFISTLAYALRQGEEHWFLP